MVVNALFLFLMFRCATDILNPGEKGPVVVALYVVAALGLTAIKIASSQTSRGDMAICITVVSLLVVNLLWIPAEATPQLYFSITILLPIIFLLILSGYDQSIFVSLRKRFLIFGTPVLFGLIIFFILGKRGPEADLLKSLNEQPFHVVAQTIAKFSILLLGTQWIGPIISLVLLIVLNVRSALLAFLLALLIKKYRSFWSLKALLVMLVVSAISLAFLMSNPDVLDAFLQRVIYRDRDSSEPDIFNMTSGRDEIWLYYSQMLQNSSLFELLFGRGAIWLYGSFPLEAHNDLLNMMACYGLAGTAAVIFAWYVILSRLHPDYRMPCVGLFLVLFATNGVVFHQSNLLFLLFMAGEVQQKQLSGDEVYQHEDDVDAALESDVR